ncbi:MFS general substrate transporter [Sodiomyces alkalinus F11]|uniref:MFS general substrate transporter n=1 Tax=Sodiomyces alkalinus (strain CBS 110278 / VKM F-3762 / F11) TaxID=1314773 RepID=A0A3N2Q8B0_SODAK|nr:MFS general substrate transporter [Sodiomyces alkalinus F11]ROT43004.1 MFS general substrate transporter [Sodiomyces alkalinus F11]
MKAPDSVLPGAEGSNGVAAQEANSQTPENHIVEEKITTTNSNENDKDLTSQQQLNRHDDTTVWWDGDNDPENPYNWPAWRKYTNCGLISFLTFVTPLASSIFAPGVPQLMVDFGSSNQELAAFVVSVYVLGFAFGPMLMAPLSELYGRLPVYHVSNLCFVAFTVGCALAPTLDSLIAFRFLAGAMGACPLTNGGGSIADMIPQEKRAAAMSVFSIGPLLGPVLGPVIGGVLQEQKGWRWVFWVVAAVSGFLVVAMLLLMRETYAPVLLDRKARRLRRETGNPALRSRLDKGLTEKDLVLLTVVRPLKLLLFSPICTVFALYMVLVYGYLYILFTSVPFVFQRSYGFSTSDVGLVYLGLGVGSMIGMAWFSVDTSRDVKAMKKLQAEEDVGGHENENGHVKPEIRLKLLPHGAILLPVGFFIYGWTADYETHWMGPIMGLTVIGVGNILCFITITMYLVDAYTMYSASALAANTIIRSIAGAVLPLCALEMYDVLGLGWGNSLLGFIATAFIPVPFLILRYGEKLRTQFNMDTL